MNNSLKTILLTASLALSAVCCAADTDYAEKAPAVPPEPPAVDAKSVAVNTTSAVAGVLIESKMVGMPVGGGVATTAAGLLVEIAGFVVDAFSEKQVQPRPTDLNDLVP